MAQQTYQQTYYQENREALLESRRAWYAKNKQKVIANAKKRQQAMPKEKRKAVAARYYKRHRSEILKRARERYLANRVRIKARVKEHAKAVRHREREEGVVRGRRVGLGVRTN